ncbi:MAG: hypothetical protein ACRDNF_19740, partial [Streptosporangiaceae bacterium]
LSPEMTNAEALACLRERHPEFNIWTVSAGRSGVSWCARPLTGPPTLYTTHNRQDLDDALVIVKRQAAVMAARHVEATESGA